MADMASKGLKAPFILAPMVNEIYKMGVASCLEAFSFWIDLFTKSTDVFFLQNLTPQSIAIALQGFFTFITSKKVENIF